MKKIVFYSIALFLMVSVSSPAFAQGKIKLGHINSNDLMEMMPGRDTAQTQLENYAKGLESQLIVMSTEFETKYQEFLANEATYLEPVKKSKQQELIDLQNRITDFQSQAQTLLTEKESELIQPLIDKAKGAIDAVAKEKGYTYIFDTGVGTLIYYEDSDDIMPFVKEKLGIKE
ncbi:MAG: OmpH family outer membrane protein [Bacteroidales bacterium]|nr:OmpH family outer membrane protein [Bacteroidales bacterium]